MVVSWEGVIIAFGGNKLEKRLGNCDSVLMTL